MDQFNFYWTVGTLILDDYQIEEILGQGGLGTVYRARSISTGSIYAIKRILPELSANPERRRTFLSELLIWSGLPVHPNLTAFRFFRRFHSEILVFLEFVDGGALSQWIQTNRITDLPTALDIAIQSAWGIAAAHRHDLVHLDIKPGNILMTSDKVAKITDFSLAKFRNNPPSKSESSGEWMPETGALEMDSVRLKVSCRGMTPAYCSPEQAQGFALDQTTDVWSWGVSILELLNEHHHRHLGISAPFVLDQWKHSNPVFGGIRIPEQIPDILERCFQKNSADRWQSMLEPAKRLIESYERLTGTPYPRSLPDMRVESPGSAPDSVSGQSQIWLDPEKVVTRIRQTTGIDYSTSIVRTTGRKRTPRGDAMADLIAFDDILLNLEAEIGRGNLNLEVELARVSRETAFIHHFMGDLPGRLQLMRQAADIFARRITPADMSSTIEEYLQTLNNLGVSLSQLSRYQEAVLTYRSALELIERMDEGAGRLCSMMFHILPNLANALRQTGQLSEAIDVLDKAIDCSPNAHEDPRSVTNLAYVLTSKAQILEKLGRFDESLSAFDRAIAMYESLRETGDHRIIAACSQAYCDKAIVLDMMKDYPAALNMYSQAIRITEALVESNRAGDRKPHLARMYVNEGLAYLNEEKFTDSIRSLDHGVSILRDLIFRDGRSDLLDDYALALINQSHPRIQLGDWNDAIRCLDDAENYCDRLKYTAPQIQIEMYLGMIRHLRARIAKQTQNEMSADQFAREAVQFLNEAIRRSPRSDVRLLMQEVVAEFQLET